MNVAQHWLTSLLLTALVAASGSDAATQSSAGAAAQLGQDALGLLPDTYRLQFENAWTRGVRVHIAAGANLPRHDHVGGLVVYVYLTNAPPLEFAHEDFGRITRREVEARSYRVNRTMPERHAIVNRSAIASEYLRIEIKATGNQAPERRFAARPLTDVTATVVDFTSDALRTSRLTIASGQSLPLVTPATEPALLISLTDAQIGIDGDDPPGSRAGGGDGADGGVSWPIGQERFVQGARRLTLTNRGTAPIELLRLDFLLE